MAGHRDPQIPGSDAVRRRPGCQAAPQPPDLVTPGDDPIADDDFDDEPLTVRPTSAPGPLWDPFEDEEPQPEYGDFQLEPDEREN